MVHIAYCRLKAPQISSQSYSPTVLPCHRQYPHRLIKAPRCSRIAAAERVKTVSGKVEATATGPSRQFRTCFTTEPYILAASMARKRETNSVVSVLRRSARWETLCLRQKWNAHVQPEWRYRYVMQWDLSCVPVNCAVMVKAVCYVGKLGFGLDLNC